VHLGAPQPLGIGQPLVDQFLGIGEGLEQTHLREVAEIPDHRRHGHLLEQRLPDFGPVEGFGGQGFPGEPVGGDEFDQFLDRGLVGFGEHRLRLRLRRVHVDELDGDGLFGGPDEVERLVAGGDGGFRPFGFLFLRGPAEELTLDFRLGHGLGEPQDVLHRPPFPLLVFHELEGERLGLLPLEPELDGLLQPPTPTPEPVDGVDELEELRARFEGGGNRGEGRLPGGVVALRGGEREDEDPDVGLGSPAGLEHLDGLRDDLEAILLEQKEDQVGVFGRQLLFGDVEGTALGTEDQEPFQLLPFVELEDEAPGVVLDHVPAGDGETLGGLGRVEAREGLLDVVFHVLWCP